jgi:putative membrane protein
VKAGRKSKATEVVFAPEPEPAELVTVAQTVAATPARHTRWLSLLAAALLALSAMWASLSIVQLIESFFARNAMLGWLALGLAMLAGVSSLAIILREIVGLARLGKIEKLQENAARAINLNERASADSACAELQSIYATRADLTWGMQRFKSHSLDILDPRDRLRLAEQHLLVPLDEMALKLIARRARRVTLLTTVTPAAALDILFVAAQNFGMLRELATLYGGRPSTLATFKLARMVVSHLAVTGGLALSDNLIQHLVGKGLLGRLSARFGEGAVNGILTTRIGLAALDVCRPVPKNAASRESLTTILKEVMNFSTSRESPDDKD